MSRKSNNTFKTLPSVSPYRLHSYFVTERVQLADMTAVDPFAIMFAAAKAQAKSEATGSGRR